MNAADQIEQNVKRRVALKHYKGPDRIVFASEKKKELDEERLTKPKFLAFTDIQALDECTEGFRKGQLIILSGPPKNGKTQFCQTLTKNFIQKDHKCLWFSYELCFDELFDKFALGDANLDFLVPNYMQSGNLSWVEDRIIEAKEKHGLDIVFLDHLDFLKDPEKLSGVSINLAAYVGGITQKVKRIAVEQELVIILMSHIRKNNWTTNELPSAEELRDSGQIAQLADIVMMIMRTRADRDAQEVYVGNFAKLGVMENRHNGKTKKIDLVFKDGSFVEIEGSQMLNDIETQNHKQNSIKAIKEESLFDKGL